MADGAYVEGCMPTVLVYRVASQHMQPERFGNCSPLLHPTPALPQHLGTVMLLFQHKAMALHTNGSVSTGIQKHILELKVC